jgi:uncharacterized OB-fold protein
MSIAHLPPSPEPNAETAPFWEAANESRLLLKRCLTTGKAFHPPRSISPFTGLAQTEWIEASGAGTVYSFSVSMRQETPHCIAYVTLEEGPTVLSCIIDYDPSGLHIGQPVHVVFVPSTNGQMVPMFVPDTP